VRETSSEWLNVANFFTLLRVLLAPVIIILLLYEGRLPYNVSVNVVAGVLFVAAALTDKADGYYARKHNQVTSVGQFLDPLADKLLMLPVMAVLWYIKLLPLWVVIAIFAREIIISVIRVIGARKGISFPASWSGKIKMFSQVIVASVLIFFPKSANNAFVLALVYIMAAITIYSGIDYLVRARSEIFKPAADAAPGAGKTETQ
jgi:CDP-diacylglycerol--glycerol-3-phosphate 3-phosphatidyltransferase